MAFVLEAIIEEKQEAPLRELIKEHGGWPVLESHWSENGLDLSVILAKLKTYNHFVFINHWINTDDKDSETNIIQVYWHSLFKITPIAY